jgi:Zn-finger nucleic acid-binding protein
VKKSRFEIVSRSNDYDENEDLEFIINKSQSSLIYEDLVSFENEKRTEYARYARHARHTRHEYMKSKESFLFVDK